MPSPSPLTLCACANIKRAGRAVNHLYDLVLAPTGLRTSQFLVLWEIATSGESAHCDLARRFAASEETFSRRLASARKAGWVRMNIDSQRRRVYSLTEAGRALVHLAVPFWERAQERLRGQLGEKDWDNLGAFAERIARAAMAAERVPSRNSRPHSEPSSSVWSLALQNKPVSVLEPTMNS